jgi:MFS family permease
MRDIITQKSGNYFGRRNKIVGAIALGVLLISGFVLDYFKGKEILFFGFLILFGFAFIARSVSAYLFTKHYEPELKLEKGYYFTLKQFIKKIPESNFGKFSVLVAMIMLATSIASPFFSVYMLNELHFSYKIWTMIVIASSLGSLLFMQVWGRFADKYGNLKVIKITGLYIPLVPLVWVLSPLIANISNLLLFIYLLTLEFVSGVMWAGFNLSSVNFIYDASTRQRIPLCVAYFNVLSGIGIFIGATLGGFISSFNFVLFGMSPILFIFFLSFVLRFGAYILMISKVKEVREVEKYEKGGFRKEFRDSILYITNKFIKPRPT